MEWKPLVFSMFIYPRLVVGSHVGTTQTIMAKAETTLGPFEIVGKEIMRNKNIESLVHY